MYLKMLLKLKCVLKTKLPDQYIPEFPKNHSNLKDVNILFFLQCVQEYRERTKSSKCPFPGCLKVYLDSQIVPITGRDRAVFKNLSFICANHKCNHESNIGVIDEHTRVCSRRGAYKAKDGLRGKKSYQTDPEIGSLREYLQNHCESNNLELNDLLFFLLKTNLEKTEVALYRNIDTLYEAFSKGIYNLADFLPERSNPYQSAALKAFANLTVGQYIKVEAFQKQEHVRDKSGKLSEYKLMLKAEKEVDIGNTNYKLFDKRNDICVKDHIATTEDTTIDIMEDVGSLTPGFINIPVDGGRVSLVDSIACILSDIYPDIAKRAADRFPGLWLPDHIIRVHVKQGWDGTLGKSQTDKKRERDECDHWLAGCLCVLQLDVEWGNGTRSVLWIEEEPNSILSCPPLGLYKGEEANRPTLSYIMHAVETEVEDLSKSFLLLESHVCLPEQTIEHHGKVEAREVIAFEYFVEESQLLPDEEMDIENNDKEAELSFDDIVREEYFNKYKTVDNDKTNSSVY